MPRYRSMVDIGVEQGWRECIAYAVKTRWGVDVSQQITEISSRRRLRRLLRAALKVRSLQKWMSILRLQLCELDLARSRLLGYQNAVATLVLTNWGMDVREEVSSVAPARRLRNLLSAVATSRSKADWLALLREESSRTSKEVSGRG